MSSKKSVFLLLALLWAGKSWALLITADLGVWPTGPTIRQRPVFVINAYDFVINQQGTLVLSQLNKRCSIYLVSGFHKVPLRIQDTCTGSNRRQVVLVPRKELVIGRSYRMVLSLPKEWKGYARLAGSTDSIPLSWRVVATPTTDTLPIWQHPPEVSRKKYISYPEPADTSQEFHRPPDRLVVFRAELIAPKEVLVKVSLQSISGSIKSSYYVPLDSGQLSLWDSWWFGYVELEDNATYAATFDVLAATGSSLPWQGPEVVFDTKWTAAERTVRRK